MPDLVVTETHMIGRDKFEAGYTYPVTDEHYTTAVEAGWGHAPGETGTEPDRAGVHDLEVDTIEGAPVLDSTEAS